MSLAVPLADRCNVWGPYLESGTGPSPTEQGHLVGSVHTRGLREGTRAGTMTGHRCGGRGGGTHGFSVRQGLTSF